MENEESPTTYHFDPIDMDLLRLRHQIPPSKRILTMLAAREFLVGAIRGRLQRRFPNLSRRELNLKVLEEIERVRQYES